MKTFVRHSAFTLIELLVVISIIGILAAIAMPVISNFRKSDAMVAASSQLLHDIEHARQLAITHRTTVYMVFCPSNFWDDVFRVSGPDNFDNLPLAERNKGASLLDKQLKSYTFVTLRSVGNQPGQLSPRYLSEWRTLPEGAIIPTYKFRRNTAPPVRITNPVTLESWDVRGFSMTNSIPFPTAEAFNPANPFQRFVTVPYIAFNYLGQLVPPPNLTVAPDEFIPLAKGEVYPARNPDKIPIQQSPTVTESPPGNSTNSFLLIRIDGLTGRPELLKQELP